MIDVKIIVSSFFYLRVIFLAQYNLADSKKVCTFAVGNILLRVMSTPQIAQTIAEYFKTQPVLKAWLFGSFARGEETPHSDVDILFVPDYSSGKPFTLFTHGGMLMDLQELLGRDVDLVVDGTLRPYAEKTANRDKILIYERKSER